MKNSLKLKTALLCLLLNSGISQAADRVGDFSLIDQIGNFHQMSWYNDNQSIALLVQANGSKATLDAIPRYIALQKSFASQGIQFFMINPMGRLNRDAVNAEISALTTDIPVLMDDTQLISEALDIDKSGEVFLFNAKSFRVVFRGPVGDEFESAMEAILSDSKIAISKVAMQGSDVHYSRAVAVSYQNDIAPVIAQNCATCHREGGIAPFALDSYAMVQGWSPMIREVLMTKRMPPGQVDPHVHKFTNGRNLNIKDAQNIVRWIEDGSKRDGTHDLLAELSWPDTKWNVEGEPDLIVKIPAQEIPATGVLEYVRLQVPIIGMQKDRWLRASEFIPGDRTVVHHATGGISSAGETTARRDPDVAVLNRYVPGAEPRIEPPNTGGLLKKDSVINVVLHYTTSGKAAIDESEFGLWFYPEDVVPEERMKARLIGNFANEWNDIPPYAKNFEVSNSFILPEDVDVYQYHPHMHFRGKDLRMFADYPDGTHEELINIANYSYAWQLTYDLEKPIPMPKGTRITTVAHFDNSSQNLANPDPSRAVPWGEQSWDEMFFGEIIWKARND
ncbi:MAG: hypothetical protein COA96_11635 [SAR86 cluster bacterium]|uniref:Cytochrome c domain-containing protein n=1 Tax=SAR86 cluster bacterium TaxID=2030880 RepID=A0A2A5AW82_9GAMM|nr:MAG: hypothetical protein COA96_11635 [SAR86 cluster bacterium]